MKLLAFDTSTNGCSVALMQDNHIASISEVSSQQKSRHILTMMNSLLVEAHLSFSELDAIAFGAGPGSFTGIRLAASVAQGIGFAQNLPVIPVSSMQAMAQSAFNKNKINKLSCIGVALNAHSGDIYWAAYEKKGNPIAQPLLPETRCLPQELPLKEMKYDILMGDAWEHYPDLSKQLPPETCIDAEHYPYAEAIAMIAGVALSDHIAILPEKALPLYLHKETMWRKQA